MQKILKTRGLRTTGRKIELIERLRQNDIESTIQNVRLRQVKIILDREEVRRLLKEQNEREQQNKRADQIASTRVLRPRRILEDAAKSECN